MTEVPPQIIAEYTRQWAPVLLHPEAMAGEVLQSIPKLYKKAATSAGPNKGTSTSLMPPWDEMYAETDAHYWTYFLGIDHPPALVNLEGILHVLATSQKDSRPDVPVGTAMFVCGAVFVWTEEMRGIKAPWLLTINKNWVDTREKIPRLKNYNRSLYYPYKTWKHLISALLFLERHTVLIHDVLFPERTVFNIADQADANEVPERIIPYSPVHRVFFTHMPPMGWCAWLGVPTAMAQAHPTQVLVPQGVRLGELSGKLTRDLDHDTYAIDHYKKIVCSCRPGIDNTEPGVGSWGFLMNCTCDGSRALGKISFREGLKLRKHQTIIGDPHLYRKHTVIATRDITGGEFLDKTAWALTKEFSFRDKPYSCVPLEWVYHPTYVRSAAQALAPLEGTSPPGQPQLLWYRCQCATTCFNRPVHGLACFQKDPSGPL